MTAITVTASESGSTFPGVLLQVKVLTNVAASPIGATATQSSNAGASHQAFITTTQAGSQVYAASANVGSGTAYTANGNTTLFTDHSDSGNGLETGTGRSTSATGTPGSIDIGFINPQGGGGVALLEILPNGTITEDASSPAAVYNAGSSSVTTASFNPPAGALLVAMVGADANTSTTLTVLDSSSLTWTQQVVAQTSGALYAGIWTAVVPGGGATNISVSDVAGVVESFLISAAVATADVAGLAESIVVTPVASAIFVTDTAAMVETRVIAVTTAAHDAGASLDTLFNPGSVVNRNLPAIVFMAAAYQGAT